MYHCLEDQKGKIFSRQQKIHLVTEFLQNEKSLKRRSFAEDNHVNYKTFCDWIQAFRKGKLQQDNNQAASSPNIKEETVCHDTLQTSRTIPDVLFKALEDDLIAWFRSAILRGSEVTWGCLKKMAKVVAKRHLSNEAFDIFKVSDSWLLQFLENMKEKILKVCKQEDLIGVDQSPCTFESDQTFPFFSSESNEPCTFPIVQYPPETRKRSFPDEWNSFEPLKRPYHDENLVTNGQFMNLPAIISPFLSSSPALLLHFFTYVHNPWLLNLPQEEQSRQLQNCSNQLLLMILVQNKVASQCLRVNIAPQDAFLSMQYNKTLLPSPTCISCIPDGEVWPVYYSSSSVEESSEEDESDDVDDDNELFSSEEE
eukprot:gene12305-13458_t